MPIFSPPFSRCWRSAGAVLSCDLWEAVYQDPLVTCRNLLLAPKYIKNSTQFIRQNSITAPITRPTGYIQSGLLSIFSLHVLISYLRFSVCRFLSSRFLFTSSPITNPLCICLFLSPRARFECLIHHHQNSDKICTGYKILCKCKCVNIHSR